MRRRREALLRRRQAPVQRNSKGHADDSDADELETVDDAAQLTPRRQHALKNRNCEEIILQLVTHLDQQQVERMHAEFAKSDLVVTMLDFVHIVRSILPAYITKTNEPAGRKVSAAERAGLSIIANEFELVRNLVELFNEVDVNGDGDIEWEEFTRFVVEKARLFKEQNALELIPDYVHVTDEDRRRSTDRVEGPRFRNLIDKICPVPDQRLVAVAEQHSSVVQLFDARTAAHVSTIKSSAVPLAMCYVEQQQSLLVACSDMTLATWQLTKDNVTNSARFKDKARWPTPDTLMCLCWADSQKLAYSGSTAGTVHAWNIEEREHKMELKGHTDIVMEVLHIKYLDNIVSASLDTTVRVWDTYTERESTLLLGHSKGVSALTYNAEHRFLISAGFDHDAFVWSPFVKTLLFKLKGHRAALVGCEAVEGTHELLTADCLGIVKLWDLRNFQCMQTFTSTHEPGDLDDLRGFQALTHVKLPPKDRHQDEPDYRIVAGSKKLFFFDQLRVRKEPVTDDLPLRLVILNDLSLTVLVVSDRSVKIWDAILGSLKRVYKDIAKNVITAVCLDDRRRKFFLGDSAGCLTCHNYQNGSLMKRFPPFKAPVMTLEYLLRSKALIASCVSGTIRVIDEKELEICAVLRQFDETYTHRGDLALFVHHESASLAASASAAAIEGVRLWDSATTKCESMLKTPGYSVLAIGFLEPFPLLYVCSSDGMVRVWAVAPASPLQGVCLLALANRPPDGSYYDFPEQTPVSSAGSASGGRLGNDVPATSPHMSRPRLLPPPPPSVAKPVAMAREPSDEQEELDLEEEEEEEAASVLFARARSTESLQLPGRLPEGVCASPAPVASAAFDASTCSLVVGDELGNLRCYDLSLFIRLVEGGVPCRERAVPANELSEKYAVFKAGVCGTALDSDQLSALLCARLGETWRQDAPKDSSDATAVADARAFGECNSLKPHEVKAYEAKMAAVPSSVAADVAALIDPSAASECAVALLPARIASFAWGVEYAHEDAILALSSYSDPKAIISSGLDRCVRMWDIDGTFRGVLLQGLEAQSTNPCWSLDLDVQLRDGRETESISEVTEALDELAKERAAALLTVQRRPSLHELNGRKGRRRASSLFHKLEKAKEADRLLALPQTDRPSDLGVGGVGGGGGGVGAAPHEMVPLQLTAAPKPLSLQSPQDAKMHSRVTAALSDVKSMTGDPVTSEDPHGSSEASWPSSGGSFEVHRRGPGRRSRPSLNRQPTRSGLESNVSSIADRSSFQSDKHQVRDLPAFPTKPKPRFLSVVPPLPNVDKLSPDAQKSLDRLTQALQM